MATKQVSLRLGAETIQELDYLQIIAHKSQAAIVADLVHVYYHTVVAKAFGMTKQVDLNPELVIRGGTIITVEEQKALMTVRDRLAGRAKAIDGGR